VTEMQWERAEEAQIDPSSYYVVQTNGGEWRDFDLSVWNGRIVQASMVPDYVRGRPVWVAKIIRPESSS
jgi:hypothetical protein